MKNIHVKKLFVFDKSEMTKDIQPQCEVFLEPYFVQVLAMGVNCKRLQYTLQYTTSY